MGQTLENCARSVLETDYNSFEAILVDNGSSDDCTQRVFRKFETDPRLKLMRFEKNLGFTGGNNRAFKQISSDSTLVAFLNSDVVVERRWLTKLVAEIDSSEGVGIVGPSGKLLTEGVMPISVRSSVSYHADHIEGHCMMMRCSLFRRLRGFNESFFMYFDEVDLCERARSMGMQSLVVSGVVVNHSEGTTVRANDLMARRAFLMSRNMTYVVLQNYPAFDLLLAFPLIFLNRAKRFVSLALHRNPSNSFGVAKGWFRGVLTMKNGAAKDYGRRPFKDPLRLPAKIDLVNIFTPRRFSQSFTQSILLSRIKTRERK